MATLPSFYNPSRIGSLFYPDVTAIAKQASDARLAPASEDEARNHLLIIDMQIDFCHEQGALRVPGAKEDIRRLTEFIYRHAERITGITCSMDSHLPNQIFNPSWWVNEQGHHPVPFTVITAQDVQAGTWRPLSDPKWSLDYLNKLEEQAKKALVVWPYHALIGGVGNGLDPELWSAVFWHSLARRVPPAWWRKGSIPQTEHYSILKPEIEVPEHPETDGSQALLDRLAEQDHIIIAGEAASHCVLETIEDLINEFKEPERLSRVVVLRDCTSPVLHPEIDFEAITERQFARFAEQGIKFVDSTDPLPF